MSNKTAPKVLPILKTHLKVSRCHLDGILIFEPETHFDNRGHFLESFQIDRYWEAGITEKFVQDNLSHSMHGVLRGLHFTRHTPQAQLITLVRGSVFDVAVDIRPESPTYLKWNGIYMTTDGVRQVFMPHGYAHGFLVLSDEADLHYKVTAKYTPKDNFGIRWNDPRVGIEWPLNMPLVSERDSAYPLLETYP